MDKTEENIFKRKSNWEPSNIHHTVQTFCDAIRKDIHNSTNEQTRRHNLKKDEIQALEELRQRDDLIFTKADKGGALVIMDVQDYIREAERQLSDKRTYKKLPSDPTTMYAERINKTIDRFKEEGVISEKVADGLKTVDPKTAKLNLCPKIHKEGNPGRPIINSRDCHSSNISKYVDHHLQPEVVKLKSYVQDSTDAINKLEAINQEMDKDDILVTMDVRSLYTNIPNHEGIQAVRDTLNNSSSSIPTRIITTFLTLILTLNNFIFNGTHYLQNKGSAMGTKCAPPYANIFMGRFEEQYIYPRIIHKTRLYLRFIDDIIFIWKGTEKELKKFLDEINQLHPTIKFDHKYSKSEIEFLDLKIYKDAQGKLATKIYSKPTDRQAYLHKSSAHPHHLKKSIPYGQALRMRRICTDREEFEKASEKLTTKLKERGYTDAEITTQINRARAKPREDLLNYTSKEQEAPQRIPYVVTYFPDLPDLKNTIDKHWPILNINEKMRKTFAQKPIMAYRRNRNLGDILGQKTLENNKVVRKGQTDKTGGCTPCLSKGENKCCKQIRRTKKFKSNRTNKSFNIFHKVNCKSKWVIYLMECIICRIQYVGKSEWPMNIRINKHRYDVPRFDSLDVCQHFRSPGHDFDSHAKFTIIEELKQKNKPKHTMRKILEQREDSWVIKLRTLNPDGFNKELNDSTTPY